jgi:tetratricopeptide (TPR) repeat protein
VNSFLFEVNDSIADVSGTTAARHLLAQRAQQYLDILARDRSSDPALQRGLALAYRKLGDILGRPYYANLGDTSGALANYRKAAVLLERLSAAGAQYGYQDPALMTELGLLYGREGRVSQREGNNEETLRLSQKGVDLLVRSLARNPSSRDLRLELTNAYANVAWAWLGIGDDKHSPEPANRVRESLGKALTIVRPAIAQSPEDDQFHFVAARCNQGMALAEALAGNYGEDPGVWGRQLAFDLKAHEQILAVYRINPSKYRRVMGSSWDELDRAYLQAGDAPNAMKAGKESLVFFEEITKGDPDNKESRRDLAMAHQAIGGDLEALHRDQEAVAERQRALEFFEWILSWDSNSFQDLRYVVELRTVMADRALRAGDHATAMAQCRRSLALLANHPETAATIMTAVSYGLLGKALAGQAEAAASYGKALALWERLRDSGQLPPKYAGKPAEMGQALAHIQPGR